jgi:acetyl-CoA C-acetyltransferase
MTQAPSSVIVAGARTPIGRFLGSLSGFTATALGGLAVRAALEKSQVPAGDVDHVVLGQVLQAGCGQNPARTAAAAGGIPLTVPAITLNKVCLSGLNAIAQADLLIRSGEAEVVVAGGMESMSRAPHLLPGSRQGLRYGDAALVDHLAHDGLWDQLTAQAMGGLTDAVNAGPSGFSRAEQDAYAVRSHRRAAAAAAAGVFDDEIVPVPVPQRRGDPLVLAADEGVRPDTDLEALARLRPAFGPEGTITAGSSSPISDGAAAVVVMSRTRAEAAGLSWIAEIGAHGQVAGPDSSLQQQPANAIRAALARSKARADLDGGALDGGSLDVGDLDLIEINEAFAAVALASTSALGVDPERVNVNGGAIAVGHPLGVSGTRIALHLALELRRRGGGTGVAALCGGGGQGDALILRVPASDRS